MQYRCRICGKITELTKDHVPPKSLGNYKNLKYNKAFSLFDDYIGPEYFSRNARGGLYFQTICKECNSHVLGDRKDRALKEFYDSVANSLSEIILVPRFINCSIEVNNVARSVIGHLLAAKEDYDSSKKENVLREYVLNEDSMPPAGMKLYYFLYPYKSIFINRDSAYAERINYKNKVMIFSCFYVFPIAFLLTSGELDLELNDMFSYCTDRPDERKTILFDLESQYIPHTKNLRHFQWPFDLNADDSICIPSKYKVSTRTAPL